MDTSITTVDVAALLPAASDFKYLEGENADYLRQEAAEIRAELIAHNRSRINIAARLIKLEPELKDQRRFMYWCRVHFAAPDAPYKCSYETLQNYMNLLKHSTGNPQIPDRVKYEAYRNNPDPTRISIAQRYEETGKLNEDTARVIRRAPMYVVEKMDAGLVDIPTARQFTEAYLKAPQPVQRIIETEQVHRAVTVHELTRAYEDEGRGKTTRFTEVKDDASLNFINGERVPLAQANELHWHKFMVERQAIHRETASLTKYDWYVEQMGELYTVPKGEAVVLSTDEDALVFIIHKPAPDMLKQSGRRGKIKLGLEVRTRSE